MGAFGEFLAGIAGRARQALKSYTGPYPVIKQTGRNCLIAFQQYYYSKANPLQPGRRILKGEGEEAAVVSIGLSDLAAKPLLLHMGLKEDAYGVALYVVEKGNQKFVVVAHTTKAILENMPGPDLYVIPEGKYLSVGRSRQTDLTVPYRNIFLSVSGEHLRIAFPAGSQRIYVIDTSRNGSWFEFVEGSADQAKHPDAIPLKMRPSDI
jgi:hypothetical protein